MEKSVKVKEGVSGSFALACLIFTFVPSVARLSMTT